ncbi:MAG: DMT family transporter [Aestuariivirga sp.]|uniref:DMT family transporter n=1 Tax=Aestuariivirga sp. TaxID=2650926 RepID=UPI0038D1F70D
MTVSPNLRAILAMVAAMGLLVASDSCMKLGLAYAPLFQLMAIRGLVSVTLCLVLIVALGQAAQLPRMFNGWLAARGVLETVANIAFTSALAFVAIADVTAIAQTCPLLVLLGAWAFRGEKLGLARGLLILVGIAGALLVAQPGAGAASFYAMLAFLTPLAAAVRDLITPNAPKDVPPLVATLAVMVCLGAAGLIGMLAFNEPVTPVLPVWLLMGLAGAMSLAGHLLLYLAYRIGQARTVAPFMYSLTIWAVLSGLVLFGEIPNALAIAGMALISATGLAIIWLDGRQRREG